MKKLAIIAFAALATSAFAGGGGGGGDTCSECPEIVIDGTSVQVVAATSSLFMNLADGKDAYAQQNVSSNSGNVTVEDGGESVQLTATRGPGAGTPPPGGGGRARPHAAAHIWHGDNY